LHGLPYALAPAAQTNVPFIFWASDGFYESRFSNLPKFASTGEERLSHDNIAHTLLGIYDIDASSYSAKLDIFSGAEDPRHGHRVASANSSK
jgi:lipid A ethanolaminephosphotransferase